MLGVVKDARVKKEEELRGNGFRILRETEISELFGTAVVQPDLVAVRSDEVVVVEFAQRRSNASLPDEVKSSLAQLSAVVEANPNWQLELVWIGEDATVPEEQAVKSYAHRALLVSDHDEAAGLLLAFAALEGAIARLAARAPELHGQSSRLRRPGLAQLASLGLIGAADFSELNSARRVRNSIAHGIDVPIDAGMVQYVVSMAERLADVRYVSVDQMVDWFFEHYEDPANGVPFDSREGGYQYVGGGPYDAEDVLVSQFPDASPGEIGEAVMLIDHNGSEWVKKGDY
jgi:hypothetical protein